MVRKFFELVLIVIRTQRLVGASKFLFLWKDRVEKDESVSSVHTCSQNSSSELHFSRFPAERGSSTENSRPLIMERHLLLANNIPSRGEAPGLPITHTVQGVSFANTEEEAGGPLETSTSSTSLPRPKSRTASFTRSDAEDCGW